MPLLAASEPTTLSAYACHYMSAYAHLRVPLLADAHISRIWPFDGEAANRGTLTVLEQGNRGTLTVHEQGNRGTLTVLD